MTPSYGVDVSREGIWVLEASLGKTQNQTQVANTGVRMCALVRNGHTGQ